MGWWITLYTTDGQASLGDPEGLHPLTKSRSFPPVTQSLDFYEVKEEPRGTFRVPSFPRCHYASSPPLLGLSVAYIPTKAADLVRVPKCPLTGPSPGQVLDWSGPGEGGGGNRSNRYRTQLFSEPVSSWMHTLELPQWTEVGAGAREGRAGKSINWTLGVVEQEGRRKGREPAGLRRRRAS